MLIKKAFKRKEKSLETEIKRLGRTNNNNFKPRKDDLIKNDLEKIQSIAGRSGTGSW